MGGVGVSEAEALASRIRAARRGVDRVIGEAASVAREGQRLQSEEARLLSDLELYERTTAVLTSVGETRQDDAQRVIEQLVTRGLRLVFGGDISFHLRQSVRANRAEVDFVVRSVHDGEVVETSVMDSRGGGLVNVVAFMLRVVIMLLGPPSSRRLFALDESFGNVSPEYEPRLAEFIRALCDSAGVQVFLVTHSDAFYQAADKRYRLELDGSGYSRLREQ